MDQARQGKKRIDVDEHFVVQNFRHYVPQYLVMWAVALACSVAFAALPMTQPVSDYAGSRAFSVAFLTIAVTTVTFAIPTCMRTIFAAYEQYYSTTISKILLMRFPVTLLAISAFTSLVVSLLIISGIVGITIPVPAANAFYVALFWTVVCICYLFVAIEKMIYFVVKAPYAVLDKLEYGVSRLSRIKDRTDYDEFRRELASMNDIAATIISRSTGQDEAITKVLEAFRAIHLTYLTQPDDEDEKLATNACRAVDHEIVRMFRVACAARNEQASRNILRTYCSMMVDAMETGCGIWYFTDMLSQIERMRSYADATIVGEIKSLAYTNWVFMLADHGASTSGDTRKYTGVVRELSVALRNATLAGDDETITKFMRIASNSELDYDIPSMPPAWQTMIDRAVFIYTTWLLDTEPPEADHYLGYVKKYSSVTSGVFRSVLPDDEKRIGNLLTYETVASRVRAEAAGSNTAAKSSSNDKVVLAMSMNKEDNKAAVIATAIMLECAGLPIDFLDRFGEPGQKLTDDMARLGDGKMTPDERRRLELAECAVPGLIERMGGHAQ